ncbi:MAG: hydrogenase 2 operon protein HybA [Candidatus Neomarinimicrobiota bacterium]
MNIERRGFFKVLSAGALAAGSMSTALARTVKTLPPNAVGILYDATLCIGCKACEAGCKKANNMPADHSDLETQAGVGPIWDSGTDLNSRTLNKIKAYRHGSGTIKNAANDGYSFVKRACMHCIDPDCVSACPVSALNKDADTGIVTYNKKACIGCRYCQVACPYNIPKFEFDKAFPEIVKCEMCSHLLAEGGLPGCCQSCPTGASLFGRVEDLLDEARRRLALQPGTDYAYPITSLTGGESQVRPAARYVDYIYGEYESGGTQYLLLSAVPFDKLGLPQLPRDAAAVASETLQHTIYKGLIAPVALLGGLLYTAYRSTATHQTATEGGDHE